VVGCQSEVVGYFFGQWKVGKVGKTVVKVGRLDEFSVKSLIIRLGFGIDSPMLVASSIRAWFPILKVWLLWIRIVGNGNGIDR
jgi:hypothetical protein